MILKVLIIAIMVMTISVITMIRITILLQLFVTILVWTFRRLRDWGSGLRQLPVYQRNGGSLRSATSDKEQNIYIYIC